MSDTATDPRERLLAIGNKLLDVCYEMELNAPRANELMDARDDPERLHVLMNEEGAVEVLVKTMTLGMQRDSTLREYVAVRQTIEAMDTPRTEVA